MSLLIYLFFILGRRPRSLSDSDKLPNKDILGRRPRSLKNEEINLNIFSAKAEYKTRDYAIAISLICLSANKSLSFA